eukprot:gene5013-5254_t
MHFCWAVRRSAVDGEAVGGAVTPGLVDAAVTTEAPAAVAEALAPSTSTATPPAAAFKLPADLPSYEALTSSASKKAAAASEGAADSAGGLADAASETAAQVTDAASKAAANFSAALSGATSGITNTFSGASNGITNSLSGATSGITSSFSGLSSEVGRGASDVAGSVNSTLSSSLISVKGGLDQVKGNLDQATAGVSSAVGGAVEQLSSTTQAAAEAVNSSLSSATAAVQQTLDSVNAQVSTVTSQVATTVDSTTQQVLASLPPPVKDAAVAAGSAVATVAHAAAEHPQAAAAVTAAVAIPTAYRWYQGRYGGFAGELTPEQVLALLTNDKVFLVDIRPEQQREQDGLPELKLGARFKVAAFPVPQVDIPSKVARDATDAAELRLLVNAAYIAGLPQCQDQLTKMIIMDSTGSDKARDLARALVALNQPLSYIMEGGFNAWVEAELPVVEATEYDASTGAVIGDELEVIASKASEVAATVAQPQVGLPLVGGAALATYAALNYHTTLQYIGVVGVLLTITKKQEHIRQQRFCGTQVSAAAVLRLTITAPVVRWLPADRH